jgi:hypothetical protein
MSRNFSHDSFAAPGEFPLGSSQSRAAARMRLEQLKAARPRFELIHSIPRPRTDNSVVHEGEWVELDDGQLMRLVYLPQASEEIN